MAPKELPSPELLRKLLRYEPQTGKLFWLKRDANLFPRGEDDAPSWNLRNAGREALIGKDKWGYLRGTVLRHFLKAHRVAWAIYYGEWPEGEIDHINHVPSDNRIDNLRVVPRGENARNLPIYKSNSSGVAGVSFRKATGNWYARINVAGKSVSLGEFATLEDAAKARRAAEVQFGFHKNHGAHRAAQDN